MRLIYPEFPSIGIDNTSVIVRIVYGNLLFNKFVALEIEFPQVVLVA